MNIKKDGKVIGRIGPDFRGSNGLLVIFVEGEEISELQLRALFGTADIEILERVDGVGCYEKVQSCIIKSWELFV